MSAHLVVTIRLHDTRYHGASEWPPAPARVFQALLAGAAQGSYVPEATQRGLSWLEQQPPPVIAAPHMSPGQEISSFVPNNDADSLGGDLSLIERIRAQKNIAPRLIADHVPFLYAWEIDSDVTCADEVASTAETLYQFGRGVDMAWARTDVMSDEAFAHLLSSFRGTVHRPTAGGALNALACPMAGSLQSLMVRYQATLKRLRVEGEGRNATSLFVQPPKPRFAQVSYDSPSPSRVFELVHVGTDKAHAWRLRDVARLVEQVRDVAAHKLGEALPRLAAEIQGALVGKRPEESTTVNVDQRVRIVPLPSIGHEHADRAIRRVLVEVPHGCPLAPDDVFWAFSGQVFDAITGELAPVALIPTQVDRMRSYYERPSRRFLTVTPAALPESAKRRRIEPTRMQEERKSAGERVLEEQRAIAALRTALRHAGFHASPSVVRVQREPFEAGGARAEWFAPGTRFEKERLWHVALEFSEPIHGTLTVGDGRFLGLGLLVPQSDQDGVLAFEIQGGASASVDAVELARALRRAVMSRVQDQLGRSALPAFYTGHGADGDPAKSDVEPHISVHFDPRGRLLVVAPHVRSRKAATKAERAHWEVLDRALQSFTVLRAGRSGLLSLRPTAICLDADVLFAPARRWETATPYTLQRHPKKGRVPSEAIAREVRAACLDLGLPLPEVNVKHVSGVPGRGIQGTMELVFPRAVAGPLMLGRTRYLGGGLFSGQL